MRVPTSRPRLRARLRTLAAVTLALVLAIPGLGAAAENDPRLQQALEHRTSVQGRLDEVLQRIQALEAEVEDLERRLADLGARERDEQERATEARGQVAARIRESYIKGAVDPAVTLLTSASMDEAREQARLLGFLALRSRGDMELASAERTRVEAAAAEVAHVAGTLRDRVAQVEETRAEIATLLAEAEAEEQRVRGVIAAEERAERERQERERLARERAARARAARSSAANSSSGPAAQTSAQPAAAQAPSGGLACPVGAPRSYSDTWGAARSGGRRHMGTDILAPRGTPIYAYESGTVTRLWNSRLGGVSLYLRGDSGTQYFYTHLQGYVAGLSGGQRVAAGQHIASNGDTGNARGIPHLHFEAMPGGGGNVNPYPYVWRACG